MLMFVIVYRFCTNRCSLLLSQPMFFIVFFLFRIFSGVIPRFTQEQPR